MSANGHKSVYGQKSRQFGGRAFSAAGSRVSNARLLESSYIREDVVYLTAAWCTPIRLLS